MITDKDIRQAIRTCEWKSQHNKSGLRIIPNICTAKCKPCRKAIDDVECPILKELFKKELRGDR